MKKITAYILGLGLLVAACNPMDDIYNELDNKDNPYVESVELTFTADDYESMDGDVASNHFFTEEEPATDFVPSLLKEKYPAFDYGSSALVTYNFSVGYPDLSDYSNAAYYSLSDDDYAKANAVVGAAKYFSPKNPADKFIPGILNESVTDAEDGDIYIVAHMYSDVDPEVSAPEELVVYEHEFSGDLGNFTKINVEGDQDWYYDEYQGTGYAKISGYSGGAIPNEDWLISPEIDLSGITDATLSVYQAINYLGGEWEQVQVLISADFDGTDQTSATWTEIIPNTKPGGNNWSFVQSEDMDISDFDGETIHVAFKYISSDSNAATWEVGSLTVKGTGVASKSGVIIDPVRIEELYTYSSGWEKTEDAYYVKSVDYNAMGAPGQYDNFSSSAPADKYLPQLLEQKYPYAQDGDVMVAVYKYYSGGVQTRADEYHFNGEAWEKYSPVEVRTEQFILTKNDGWVFDPTVMYSMTSSDYVIIVDWVKTNKGDEYMDSYGTQEFWFSSGSYYSNFDIREGNWNDSEFDTWQDAVKTSISEVFLPAKFPDAVAQVSGIDVMYEITFATYDGVAGEYTFVFQCTKSGPNPEFTFVGEK
jgi:hypothetical protein